MRTHESGDGGELSLLETVFYDGKNGWRLFAQSAANSILRKPKKTKPLIRWRVRAACRPTDRSIQKADACAPVYCT